MSAKNSIKIIINFIHRYSVRWYTVFRGHGGKITGSYRVDFSLSRARRSKIGAKAISKGNPRNVNYPRASVPRVTY